MFCFRIKFEYINNIFIDDSNGSFLLYSMINFPFYRDDLHISRSRNLWELLTRAFRFDLRIMNISTIRFFKVCNNCIMINNPLWKWSTIGSSLSWSKIIPIQKPMMINILSKTIYIDTEVVVFSMILLRSSISDMNSNRMTRNIPITWRFIRTNKCVSHFLPYLTLRTRRQYFISMRTIIQSRISEILHTILIIIREMSHCPSHNRIIF